MGASQPAAEWEIKIRDEDEFWAEVKRLPESSQEDLFTFMRDGLQFAPATYIPGKCKGLRGEHKGYWEYELAQFKRIIYWPDHDARIVYIDFIGPHLDWKKMWGRVPRH